MPASFEEILNSRLFKFTVGQTADGSPTEFLVHEEAMAQLSKPLYSLMKGGWSESQARGAAWDDVSKDTFERFAQFAYTGDYSVPKTEKSNRTLMSQQAVTNGSSLSISNGIRKWEGAETSPIDEEPPEVYPVASPGSGWNFSATSKKTKKKKGWRATVEPEVVPEPEYLPEPEEIQEPEHVSIGKRDKYLKQYSPIYSVDFKYLSFPLLALRNNHGDTCEPAEHFEEDHSYSNVFLSHASLYVLGDFQLVDSLKALALFKLHKTLCVFQLDDENAEDVVDLARYAYSEEGGGGAGSDEGVGGLRNLVCQYLATNALVLSFDDGFMDLLAEGGQFVKDFFKMEVQVKL